MALYLMAAVFYVPLGAAVWYCLPQIPLLAPFAAEPWFDWLRMAFCVAVAAPCLVWRLNFVRWGHLVLVACLLVLFVQNTVSRGMGTLIEMTLLLGALAAILLLGLVAGFEIAFTQLRTREYDRIRQGRIQALLSDIESQRELFYETKEWIVVVLVVVLTLASDFDPLHVAGFETHNRWAGIAFSLLFATVMVLWVAQSPSKGLASQNPIRFLTLVGWTWPKFAAFGNFVQSAQMFWPGSAFKNLLLRLDPELAKVPDMEPSQIAFYHAALKRYGYSLHRHEDRITVAGDGSVLLVQEGLFYVVRGDTRRFIRVLEFDEPIAEMPDGAPEVTCSAEVYEVPNFGETIPNEVEKLLDDVFRRTPESQRRKRDIKLAVSPHWEVETSPDGKTKTTNHRRVIVEFESPIRLPTASAVLFRVKLQTSRQAFRMPLGNERVSDSFHRIYVTPCRKFRVDIQLTEKNSQYAELEPKAYLHSIEHSLETARLAQSVTSADSGQTIRMEMDYPLAGVKYEINWSVWPYGD